MKVELQAGDTITIPEGCKAVINDGSVVFEKVQDFKDGDVLTLLRNNKAVFIFRKDEAKQKNNENDYYVGYTASYCIDVPTKGSPFFYGHKKDVRFATEEEKQFLFNKMKEKGLRWKNYNNYG
nr:MAG TPA: JmjC domain, hydroxylase [Caudoviricetes sp.]